MVRRAVRGAQRMSIRMTRPKRDSDKRSGYSLFEVLVALVIIGMATAVVGPSVTGSLNSAARHAARLGLEQSVLEMRRAAVSNRKAYVLDLANKVPDNAVMSGLRLPSGWSYEVQPAILFHSDGTCSRGVIRLKKADDPVSEDYIVEPPECRPQR